jgi:hypothetical protein
MLSAYFDDSGTHTGGKWGPSRIVLVAGIVGTEASLRSLEHNWQKHLDHPLCGRKDRLGRFHMVDCQNSRNEFAGWNRTETDYFCHQLQTAIIESGVAAYGMACSRQDWDDLVSGDVRAFLGDAESYCISQCFVRALRWAKANTFDPQITFIFDSRTPEIERRGKTIGHAFQQHEKNPAVVRTAFLSSQLVRPLQAADMFAWELYQHAREILSDGKIKPPSRPALKRFAVEKMSITTQIAQRPSIEKIAEFVRSSDPEFVRAAGDHFTNFDPENPDYSYLYGRKPF